MVRRCTETIRIIKEKGGKGVWRWGKRERMYIYISLHCHQQNDSCIKIGSDVLQTCPLYKEARATRLKPRFQKSSGGLKRTCTDN